jgi:hypothetical protein
MMYPNQQPPMQGMANQMAQHGRYGDSMLVHMNPIEVQGLASLSPTGSLTVNPVTGQPEAFLPFLAPLLGSLAGSSSSCWKHMRWLLVALGTAAAPRGWCYRVWPCYHRCNWGLKTRHP